MDPTANPRAAAAGGAPAPVALGASTLDSTPPAASAPGATTAETLPPPSALSPRQLLPRLQCLLLALEAVPGSGPMAALAAHAPQIASALVLLIPRLHRAAAATAAGASPLRKAAGTDAMAPHGDGDGGGGDNDDDAAVSASSCAACLCLSLRCLESLAGREVSFKLGVARVVGVLAAVTGLHPPPSPAYQGGGASLRALAGEVGDDDDDGKSNAAKGRRYPHRQPAPPLLRAGGSGSRGGANIVVSSPGTLLSSCSLVACLVRHRSASLQRSMPLVAQVRV